MLTPLFSGCANFSENKCDLFSEHFISLVISLTVSEHYAGKKAFFLILQTKIEGVCKQWTGSAAGNSFRLFVATPFLLPCMFAAPIISLASTE